MAGSWETPDWSEPLLVHEIVEGTSRLRLDLSHAGGVAAEARDLHGEAHLGPLDLLIVDGESGAPLRTVPFARGPYRLFGLEPGAYSLEVQGGLAPGTPAARSRPFEVTAGSLTAVQVDGYLPSPGGAR